MKKLKERISGVIVIILAVLIGFAMGIALTEMHQNSGGDGRIFILELALAVVLAFYLMIIVHEGGHLVFGLLSGYRFSSFRIGSLMLIKKDGRLTFRKFSLAGTGGQCLMCPPDGDRVPVILYNLGGVIFNVISSLIALLIYVFYREIPLVSPLLLVFGILSAITALTNGIPMNVGGIANDGMNAVSLAKDDRAATAFLNQLRMNEAQTRNIRLSDMPKEWFSIPNDADMRNVAFASIGVFRANRTLEGGDTVTAEREINALLNSRWGIIDLHKRLLTCDLIYCRLVNGSDSGVRELITPELTKVMNAMKGYPAILRTRYAIARLMDKDDKAAAEIMESFEKISHSYPYTADLASERKLVEKVNIKLSRKDEV